MERNIISWNITNWITVILMVGVGYAVIAAVVSIGRQYGSSSVPAQAANASGTSLAS